MSMGILVHTQKFCRLLDAGTSANPSPLRFFEIDVRKYPGDHSCHETSEHKKNCNLWLLKRQLKLSENEVKHASDRDMEQID